MNDFICTILVGIEMLAFLIVGLLMLATIPLWGPIALLLYGFGKLGRKVGFD